MKKIVLLMTLLVLGACAVSKTKLSDDGADIKILPNQKNPKCSMLTKVVGENEMGSEELARNHARNLAAKADGDSIYFLETVNNANMVKVHADVYKCKDD